MTATTAFHSHVQDILSHVRISEVYASITGRTPRRTGRDTWRAAAPWRGGDGQSSVAGDDSRGVWHDFVTDESGGVLDLVIRIRGGSRADALRWIADYAGVPLDDRPLSRAERTQWARERAEAQRIREEAAYFTDAAALMAEWSLAELPDNHAERFGLTNLLAALRVSPEAEYRAWLTRDPQKAAELVEYGRERERRLQIKCARWIVAGISEAADVL